MKKLTLSDIVVLVQESFEGDWDVENIVANLEAMEPLHEEIPNSTAVSILDQFYADYDEDDSNNIKLDKLSSVIEDIRADLNVVERSIENWEDILGGDED